MASNFSFLQAEWPALYAEATKAEQAALTDPRTACFYARRTLELAVVWLFQAEGGRGGRLQMPYKPDLSAFLFEPSFKVLVGPALHAKMDVVRKQGNNAVHSARPITASDATAVLRELFQVAFWLARNYGRNVAARPDPALQFRAELLPRPTNAAAEQAAAQASAQATQAALQKLATLADELAARDAALAAAQQKTAALDAELAQLRAEVAAAKAANTATPDSHDYNEAETRDLYIDLLLKEAGWKLDQARDREFEVQGMPNAQGKFEGTGYVDYVLWGDDGKPLAVMEAKRTRRDARVGHQQAKLYADCLQTQFGQRPLIYTTNGYEHWFWDDSTYPPRPVQGFHKKDELQLLVQRRTSAKPLAGVTINPEIVERHYQLRAIRRIGETFEQDRQRKALVVMATGAGKTRTVIALVNLLQRANWAKRILFLADRVALVNQAANAFKAHLPDAAAVNLVTDKETEGRVFVSTYPTMMGLINETDDGLRRFGVGHFDLIIVDEAHRSIYQKYKAIFAYFDALLVGLTATPKDEIDRNTYSLFELENGVPTDAYGLEDAIAEKYLVPPRAVSVPLKFQREGIKYAELSEDERAQWDELDWDDEGHAPDEVGAEAVNKWLFNTDTVDKVLELLMTQGHKVAGGDRLGKTIVFAKNNAHANFIADRFNANYPHYAGQFARVITYQTEYAQSLIDDFSTKEKAPHIAISVDMLDTGIDVPEVVNLVFFKIVRSKAKFWQMVGRGTRLCKNLFGPDQHKQEFVIFDFCQNLEFFSQNLEGSKGNVAEPLSQRTFKARLELLSVLDEQLAQEQGGAGAKVAEPATGYGLTATAMRADTASYLHTVVAGMRLDNFVVRPQRRWVEPWSQAEAWHKVTSDQLADLAQHVSGLPSAVRDDDEEAKRFDLLMLRTQLGSARGDVGFARLREQVRALAEALSELGSIPDVKKHMVLIEAVAGEEWWQDVTLPMLEQARRHLRGLIKLLEKTRRKVVYTDFEDAVGETTEVALPLGGSAGDFERFRLKVRAFLRTHENHITLHKLRRNQPLTSTDLAELERLLIDSGTATAEDVARAGQEAHGLGLFVRGLVGLDREAATQALNGFVAGKTLTANQLEFVNLIVTHLTERGVMDVGLLYEPPFTSYAPQGPDALFTSAQVDELFGVLDHIKATALAA
ncbi:DEAD/DEAH box helicase family protein [Rhodoferax sp. TBRC 17198]|uniref:DEAD/DEAH box helicase family protein n=1 Tax=Rhodoferax potami TaxID=3068338 RepID=UPI0028BD2690|nr:DEAD/DEAH box helicase family protein [Rhodoferax sp. TBRC 17198]MDT7523419.1 DEAD/DEAH box helicase family protein [Rhodoferax sp. TBRC 17198]